MEVPLPVAHLARVDFALVGLRPAGLDDVWDVVAALKQRVERIAARAGQLADRPSVLTIEWVDPVMIGGMWMPELVELAGGRPLITKPGEHAPTLTLDELRSLDPDVLLVKPCGFTLDRTLAELDVLRRTLPWGSWRAVAAGNVYVADGNAFFNRPGPRIVESLEILAACLHPEEFGDFEEKHRESVKRIAP